MENVNVMGLVPYTLKEGVSEADFLVAHEKYVSESVSKTKGFISCTILSDGDKWYDLAAWESMEALQKAFEDLQEDTNAAKIMSLINQEGSDDDIPLFSVVKKY